MEEHLPSAIARIGLLLLIVTVVIRWIAGDPARWRRHPGRARWLERIGDVLAVAITVAVAGFAVAAAVLYPDSLLTGLGILALMAAWAAVLLVAVMALEAVGQRLRPGPERRGHSQDERTRTTHEPAAGRVRRPAPAGPRTA